MGEDLVEVRATVRVELEEFADDVTGSIRKMRRKSVETTLDVELCPGDILVFKGRRAAEEFVEKHTETPHIERRTIGLIGDELRSKIIESPTHGLSSVSESAVG